MPRAFVFILDQFEEFFTQSPEDQRKAIFAQLAALSSFEQSRLHVLATVRSDFLDELFQHKALYDIAKQGLDLRAMTMDELKVAIQAPLSQAVPGNAYDDFERATPQQPRSPAAQAMLMEILLALVKVSPDDDARQDVRQPRDKAELVQGSPQRAALVEQLIAARLLSVQRAGERDDLKLFCYSCRLLAQHIPRPKVKTSHANKTGKTK
ncbi:MAG: hypothetical protein HC853_14850 [Anaerolineae bacterium]|nr:hypothetical protein [Anaerolineae bacterium]